MSEREEALDIINTLIEQIGFMNIAATSGGRRWWEATPSYLEPTLTLPVRYGYRVEVQYDRGYDAYIVRRVFVRGRKRFVKGVRECVYCDEVGEAVYRAGCYMDPFGENVPTTK